VFSMAVPQHAQQKDEPTLTFRSTSNLVIVNCFVRDRSGTPVEGLTKADFKLLEDGKPQNIAVFEFQKLEDAPPVTVKTAEPTAEQSIAAPKPVAPKAPAAITPSKPGEVRYRDRRLIVFLFDFSSMQPQDQIRAQAAAQKFIRQQMTPSDVVSILTFSND